MPDDQGSDEDMASGADSGGGAFRIRVDLSEYFQQPARCLLWVPQPRDSRTVRWLARRLRRTAALCERFCLVCASHVLPPDEPLALLKPGDSLCVVRAEHEWQHVFSFRGVHLPAAPPPKPNKRRKTDTVEAEPPLPPLEPTPPLSLPPSQPTMPPPSPPMVPLSVPPTTSTLVTIKPSQDEELQRFKRRALALLQKVEGNIPQHGLEGGEDEPDGSDNWPPAKKRRRRVRRRRALPPIDFEQEMTSPASQASTPNQTVVLESPVDPTLSLAQTPPSTPELAAPTVSIPVASIPAPVIPVPSILAPLASPISSLSLPPPGPMVLRGAAAPRPPRLVRALDAPPPDDGNQPSVEHNASAAPALLTQTAVQCS